MLTANASQTNPLGFSTVDQAKRPQDFIQYLDLVDNLEAIKAYKQTMLDLLDIKPGEKLIDVGCGTGANARCLAELAGSAGRVIAIEKSQVMIIEACRRAHGLGLPLIYGLGDAHLLPVPGKMFDGVWSDRVLQHCIDPRQVVTELIRVTRTGGRIVMGVPSFSTLVVEGEDPEFTTTLMKIMGLSCHHPDVSEWLPTFCEHIGMAKITVVTSTGKLTDYSIANKLLGIVPALKKAALVDIISFEAAREWHHRQIRTSDAGQFVCVVTGIIVSGVRS